MPLQAAGAFWKHRPPSAYPNAFSRHLPVLHSGICTYNGVQIAAGYIVRQQVASAAVEGNFIVRMRLFTLGGWLMPAAAGLLLASCQSNNSTSETASAAAQTEAAPADTASVPAPNDGITAALLTQHIKVLASDEFQGRRPFTVGEEKATAYLAAEFKKLGLQPGPTGSYFQAVPLVEIVGTPDSVATVAGPGKSLALKY
jgi:hypothetical protein